MRFLETSSKRMHEAARRGSHFSAANTALSQLFNFCGYRLDKLDITHREDPIKTLMDEIDGKTRGLPNKTKH